jgi:hypothetical protein
MAEAAFDELWRLFDREYPMFVLHPEVNWAKLRDKYRPAAQESKSPRELAAVGFAASRRGPPANPNLSGLESVDTSSPLSGSDLLGRIHLELARSQKQSNAY